MSGNIAEARRTHGYLSLFGYGIDAVLVNRLIPAAAGPALQGWVLDQGRRLDEIRDAFGPLPVCPVELADREAIGLDALRLLAEGVYGSLDPAARLHHGEVVRLDLAGSRPAFELELPHVAREQVDVHRRGDELSIRVGPYRRNLCLPDGLRRRPVTAAGLSDGVLRVEFGAADPAPAPPARAEVQP